MGEEDRNGIGFQANYNATKGYIHMYFYHWWGEEASSPFPTALEGLSNESKCGSVCSALICWFFRSPEFFFGSQTLLGKKILVQKSFGARILLVEKCC